MTIGRLSISGKNYQPKVDEGFFDKDKRLKSSSQVNKKKKNK